MASHVCLVKLIDFLYRPDIGFILEALFQLDLDRRYTPINFCLLKHLDLIKLYNLLPDLLLSVFIAWVIYCECLGLFTPSACWP
jgi:hypothetical protein